MSKCIDHAFTLLHLEGFFVCLGMLGQLPGVLRLPWMGSCSSTATHAACLFLAGPSPWGPCSMDVDRVDVNKALVMTCQSRIGYYLNLSEAHIAIELHVCIHKGTHTRMYVCI